jgi:hypothetical protein
MAKTYDIMNAGEKRCAIRAAEDQGKIDFHRGRTNPHPEHSPLHPAWAKGNTEESLVLIDGE